MGFEKQQRPILQKRSVTGVEVPTSQRFDGKTVYRRVVALTGGVGTSTATVAALAGVLETLLRADVSVNDGTNVEMNNGTAVGVLIVISSGAITATHAGQTYTSDNPIVVLEYTKQ